MAARHSIFTRLLVGFGLYAVALACAMGAACWFFARDVSLDILARRANLLLTALQEAEEHARSGRESPQDARELIASLDMDFLVGKEVPPHLSALGDGIHVVGDGESYVFLRHGADGMPLAITGPIATKRLILQNIFSFFAVCLAAGLAVAALLALGLAHRLARPLRVLARSLEGAAPGSPPALPPDLIHRQDEVGLLARTVGTYAQGMRDYAEREKFFAAAASHELRTPLTVLAQTLELLEDRPQPDPATAAGLARLSRTVGSMTETVRALLTLARGEKQEVTEMDPGASLKSVLEDLLPDACSEDATGGLASRIALRAGRTVSITGEAGAAMGSPDLAAVVFRNLLENALRHGNGEIRIALAPDSIAIANEGRFVPGRNGASGFGLIITQRACERMGWRLEHAQEGEETRFLLTFPAP